MKDANVLYLSYSGMTDTLGESQVLSYLIGLTKLGYSFTVISFEKPSLYEKNRERIGEMCKKNNINWVPMMYHKSPPVLSTVYDLIQLKKKAVVLHKKIVFDIIHCRSYPCSLIAIHLQSKFNVKYIFDMRGFWPDEKVESGSWASPLFRPVFQYFKRKEKIFFKNSDYIVSLTHAGKEEIITQNWSKEDKIGVIPTCVNFNVFPPFDEKIRTQIRESIGLPIDAKVLLYSGSFGGNYDIKIPFAIFKAFKNIWPTSYFLILSRSSSDIVESYIKTQGIDAEHVKVLSVPFIDVHKFLMAGDAGLIFYGPGYSNIGRSPTKLGEYWACGMPVISLSNIGDVDFILNKYPGNGVLLNSINQDDIQKGLEQLDFEVSKEKLFRDAEDYYSLSKGVNFYANVYNMLFSKASSIK